MRAGSKGIGMDMDKLMKFARKPTLYEPGTAVMWTDPHISRQLLDLHVDPDGDVASRSNAKIDLIVDWILSRTGSETMKILDMGCGPGLYAEKFASHGHRVTGIDFSRTSIDYAVNAAGISGSGCEYRCGNYLDMDYVDEFDLVLLIYLDFCALLPRERDVVLRNVHRSLKDEGMFVFDVVNGKNIEEKILKPSWDVCSSGFWKCEPYIVLNSGYHYANDKVLVNQHIVIDNRENIEKYLFWSTYYDCPGLESIGKANKFQEIHSYENVLPEGDMWNGENVTFYTMRKTEAGRI